MCGVRAVVRGLLYWGERRALHGGAGMVSPPASGGSPHEVAASLLPLRGVRRKCVVKLQAGGPARG